MLRSVLAVLPIVLFAHSVIGGLTATVDETVLSNLTLVLSKVLDILQPLNDSAKPTNEMVQSSYATMEMTTPTTTAETTTSDPDTPPTAAAPFAFMLQSSSSNNKAEVRAVTELLEQLGLGSLGALLGFSNATTQTPVTATLDSDQFQDEYRTSEQQNDKLDVLYTQQLSKAQQLAV